MTKETTKLVHTDKQEESAFTVLWSILVGGNMLGV